MQGADGLGRIGLHAVGDDDVPGVGSVDGHVNDRAFEFAGMRSGTFERHELLIAHGDAAAIDGGNHAVAGGLDHIRDDAVVLLVRVGEAQRGGDRVRRVAFHMGREVQ